LLLGDFHQIYPEPSVARNQQLNVIFNAER